MRWQREICTALVCPQQSIEFSYKQESLCTEVLNYFFFFFNFGPFKEDIFLYTFYGLYFNQWAHIYFTDYISFVGIPVISVDLSARVSACRYLCKTLCCLLSTSSYVYIVGSRGASQLGGIFQGTLQGIRLISFSFTKLPTWYNKNTYKTFSS